MNVLPRDRQIAVIAALSEGMSIRSVERLTGIHRDTVMRLGARVGRGCAVLMDEMMRDLNTPMIEMDELWSFVGKKQKRLKPADSADLGDCYVFIALDAINKAILAFRVGKRDAENTVAFCSDLRARVLGSPQISSDAFPAYEGAITETFGNEVHYGQIVKRYKGESPVTAARRYSPGWVVGVEKRQVVGFPPDFLISTSFAERQNLSLRMASRRFTRLTNGFSKKLHNHTAAIALYVAHYNLCRVHQTIRTTPAVAIGVTGHTWSIAELIDAALSVEPTEPATPAPDQPRFKVIKGGRA